MKTLKPCKKYLMFKEFNKLFILLKKDFLNNPCGLLIVTGIWVGDDDTIH